MKIPSRSKVGIGLFDGYASDAAYLTATGSTPKRGDIYYNTSAANFRYYTGSVWSTIGADAIQQIDLADHTFVAVPTGPQTVDGLTTTVGQKVLLDAYDNQVYTVNAGLWTPAAIFNGVSAPTNGSTIYVKSGNVYGKTYEFFDSTNWRILNLVLEATTVGASLEWDGVRYQPNNQILLLGNTAQAPDNATADAIQAAGITLRGGNKSAGTGNGGDLVLSGGTSFGGIAGRVLVSGSVFNLTVPAATDPVSPGTYDIYYNTVEQRYKYWDGTVWRAFGGGSGLEHVDYLDTTTTVLPTATPYSPDGVAIADGNIVLFTNLSSNNNRIYKASVVGPVISWTLQLLGQNPTGAPTTGDGAYINSGTAHANSLWFYNGTIWYDYAAQFANRTLSNLTSPTAINQDLFWNNNVAIRQIGINAAPGGTSGRQLTVFAGDSGAGSDITGGTLNLQGGASTGNSGSTIGFYIARSNQGAGATVRTPALALAVADANVLRFYQPGSGNYVGVSAPAGVTTYSFTLPAIAPTGAGQVLTSTSTSATAWSTPTVYALRDLSNLTSPTAINQDLTFAPANHAVLIGQPVGPTSGGFTMSLKGGAAIGSQQIGGDLFLVGGPGTQGNSGGLASNSGKIHFQGHPNGFFESPGTVVQTPIDIFLIEPQVGASMQATLGFAGLGHGIRWNIYDNNSGAYQMYPINNTTTFNIYGGQPTYGGFNPSFLSMNGGSGGGIGIYAGQGSTGTAGTATVSGGLATGTNFNGGLAQILGGDGNGTGNGGSILIQTGAGTARGKLQIKDGSEGTTGYVWTSTDTLGNGHWAAATGGGSTATVSIGPSGSNADYITTGTNDQTQFAAAAADAKLTNGGTIVILPGTYTFGAAYNFTAKVWYRGVQSSAVTINLFASSNNGTVGSTGYAKLSGITFAGTASLASGSGIAWDLEDIVTGSNVGFVSNNVAVYARNCNFANGGAFNQYNGSNEAHYYKCSFSGRNVWTNTAYKVYFTDCNIAQIDAGAVGTYSGCLNAFGCTISSFVQNGGATAFFTNSRIVGCSLPTQDLPLFVRGVSAGNTPDTTSFALAASQTNAVIFSHDATVFKSIFIEYQISRNSNIQTGTLRIAQNGTVASVSDSSGLTGTTGITFNADISGGNVRLLYTSDASGTGTLSYNIGRRI